jgi:hypothetical protein
MCKNSLQDVDFDRLEPRFLELLTTGLSNTAVLLKNFFRRWGHTHNKKQQDQHGFVIN